MKTVAHKTSWIRPCTRVWLLLMSLTLLALIIGKLELSGTVIISVLLFSTLLKGQMVIDYFMGLKYAPRLWRLMVSIWLFLVLGGIALAYWLGLQGN
ncbi:cytochrome C oxidase subunit IV family protein [Candidatus Venteria ishoeyi]|nr:cytochrome C oxidase subunit IV family protein [Candidatus Venteria ishoeyi]MDM8546128.1 cytochrome C oxidase subunit IV family protein [Candidatus Venteria ishoeyi]